MTQIFVGPFGTFWSKELLDIDIFNTTFVYPNKKNCPFENNCIFLHEYSSQCKYGKLRERNNCMFMHEVEGEPSDDSDSDRNNDNVVN